jgi:hypothetical protein
MERVCATCEYVADFRCSLYCVAMPARGCDKWRPKVNIVVHPRCDHCVYWHGATTERKGIGNCPKLAMFFPSDFYCAYFDRSKEPPETKECCDTCRKWKIECGGHYRLQNKGSPGDQTYMMTKLSGVCDEYRKKEG